MCVCVCVCVCVYTAFSLLTHLLMDTGCFHILPTVNSAAVNIGVLESFRIIVLFWIQTQELNWLSCGSPVFSVLRNLKAHTKSSSCIAGSSVCVTQL